MKKSMSLKLLGVLGVGAAITLAACGGGGGDPGAPINPPSAKLTLTPKIDGMGAIIGAYSGHGIEQLFVTGGEPPFYLLSKAGTFTGAMINGNELFLIPINPSVITPDGGEPPTSCRPVVEEELSVQDSSYPQNSVKFNSCVIMPSDKVELPNTLYLSPRIQSIGEGFGAPVNVPVTVEVLNGKAGATYNISLPKTVGKPAVDPSKLIRVVPKAASSNTFEISLIAACIKYSRSIPIVITDNSGYSGATMLEVVDSNIGNDSDSGCL